MLFAANGRGENACNARKEHFLDPLDYVFQSAIFAELGIGLMDSASPATEDTT